MKREGDTHRPNTRDYDVRLSASRKCYCCMYVATHDDDVNVCYPKNYSKQQPSRTLTVFTVRGINIQI